MAMEEELVAGVVSAVSDRMKNSPNYTQVALGNFVQEQPSLSQFLSAKMRNVGEGEGVVHTVFHAEVLAECFRRHHGCNTLPPVGFETLNVVADEAVGTFAEQTEASLPSLFAYIQSNVDDPAMREALYLIALALHHGG